MTTKPVEFLGDSIDALRAFPDSARQDAGFQLDKVQRGEDPDDWKPMSTIGTGVREIRIRDEAGVPGDLPREAGRCSLCLALLPEEDAGNQ